MQPTLSPHTKIFLEICETHRTFNIQKNGAKIQTPSGREYTVTYGHFSGFDDKFVALTKLSEGESTCVECMKTIYDDSVYEYNFKGRTIHISTIGGHYFDSHHSSILNDFFAKAVSVFLAE